MGGRGLAALIPTSPPVVRSAAPSATATMVAEESAPQHHQSGLKPVDGAYFLEIPIGRIEPNPRQPRDIFDEEALKELATSISEVGLLQPIVVRATGEETYELVMGERRWRACKLAGLSEIPAIVRS